MNKHRGGSPRAAAAPGALPSSGPGPQGARPRYRPEEHGLLCKAHSSTHSPGRRPAHVSSANKDAPSTKPTRHRGQVKNSGRSPGKSAGGDIYINTKPRLIHCKPWSPGSRQNCSITRNPDLPGVRGPATFQRPDLAGCEWCPHMALSGFNVSTQGN